MKNLQGIPDWVRVGEPAVLDGKTITLIATNFVAPDIKPEDFVFGSNQLQGVVLREDGDWRDYLPLPEDQLKRNIETSACATYNTIKPIAILQEELFDLKDKNYSERFISQLSGTTKFGNTPNKVAQTIRDFGLIADKLLPFSDDISSWEEYNSFKGGDKNTCLHEGRRWLDEWNFGYDWVYTGNTTIEEKYKKLKQALKYSPIGVSVFAWIYDNTGTYIRPTDDPDNHWTTLVYIDDKNRPYVYDSYSPYLKVLEPFYDFGFAMRYSISKNIPLNVWQKILRYITNIFS